MNKYCNKSVYTNSKSEIRSNLKYRIQNEVYILADNLLVLLITFLDDDSSVRAEINSVILLCAYIQYYIKVAKNGSIAYGYIR